MIRRPWFTSFLLLIVNQSVEIEDVLRHRRATARIALATFLDACIGALAMFAVIAAPVVMIRGGSLSAQTMLFGLGTLGVYCAGRNLRWLSHESPLVSTLLWGGTIYVIKDAADSIGLTTQIGVADHPQVPSAVQATIPGLLVFSAPELRPYKPNFLRTEIEWTKEAILNALKAKRWTRADLGI